MTTKWFVKKSEIQTGPYSLEQLQEEFNTGRVNKGDYIRSEDMPEWKVAAEIKELSAFFTPGATSAKNSNILKKLNVKTLIIGGLLGLFLFLVLIMVLNNNINSENTELSTPQEEVINTSMPEEEEEERNRRSSS